MPSVTRLEAEGTVNPAAILLENGTIHPPKVFYCYWYIARTIFQMIRISEDVRTYDGLKTLGYFLYLSAPRPGGRRGGEGEDGGEKADSIAP